MDIVSFCLLLQYSTQCTNLLVCIGQWSVTFPVLLGCFCIFLFAVTYFLSFTQLFLLRLLLDIDYMIVSFQIKSIRDEVEYYVESNQDPDFAGSDSLYDELNLDELSECRYPCYYCCSALT